MNTIFLQLGSNVGNRGLYLKTAAKKIEQEVGNILNISSMHETEPWGHQNQSKFLNQVMLISSRLNPFDILDIAQRIEKDIGRRKSDKWGEREIDIDILFYNNEVISTNRLNIPHPLIHERLFVLIPLSEIAPDLVHPIYNKNVQTLLLECKDASSVNKYYV